MLIKDSAQKSRARRPNEFGMNPFTAEVLTSRGIDPRSHAERLHGIHASVSLGHRETPGEIAARIKTTFGGEPTRFQELALTPNDVIVRQLINQAALDAWDNESIAEAYCPTVLVDIREGEYKLRDRNTDLQEVDTRVGPSANSYELPAEITAGTFKVEDFSAEDSVNRGVNAIAPSIENRMIAAMRARSTLLRQHEIETAKTLMASGSYAAGNTKTIAAGAQWNGGGAADPIDDCQDAIAGSVAPPTHAVFSLETWQSAQANDDFRAIVGTRTDNVGLMASDAFALYWGLESVQISRRQYIPSGTSTLTRLYGTSNVAFVHVSRDEAARTFMRNFQLRQGAGGVMSLSYFNPKRGGYGSDMEKVTIAKVAKVIDNTYGFLLINPRQ